MRNDPDGTTGGIASTNASLFGEGFSVEFSYATLFLHMLNIEAYAEGMSYDPYWLGALNDNSPARTDSDLGSECSSTGPVYEQRALKLEGMLPSTHSVTRSAGTSPICVVSNWGQSLLMRFRGVCRVSCDSL